MVVNFTHNAFEIYDSKAEFKEGEKRYKSLLNRMVYTFVLNILLEFVVL